MRFSMAILRRFRALLVVGALAVALSLFLLREQKASIREASTAPWPLDEMANFDSIRTTTRVTPAGMSRVRSDTTTSNKLRFDQIDRSDTTTTTKSTTSVTSAGWSSSSNEFVTDPTLPKWDLNSYSANPLQPNFLLWSQRPDRVNWSEPIEMCNAVLSASNSSDPAIKLGQKWTIPYAHSDKSMANLLSNCNRFFESVPFATNPASEEESRFPLAYVFVGARNAAQAIRFLRMIYQPQNAYCLTYDKKSSKDFQETIKRFAHCFRDKNVFLSPKHETIHWGHYSLLRSVMKCIKVLLDRWKSVPWKYTQVVSWNDLPLRSNEEMVKIFQIFNGSQDSEGKPVKLSFILGKNHPDGSRRKVPPDGLRIYKGSFATSMTKEFVEFLFTDPTSWRLFEWFKGTHCAEEHYWQTIVHNIHLKAPGGFPGHCVEVYEHLQLNSERDAHKPFVSRFQIWQNKKRSKLRCHGKHTMLSCVFGVGDVPLLIRRPELIAHKFYEEFQPAAAFCLEQWFWNKASGRLGYALDESFYRSLPSVRYQNTENKDDFEC